MMKKTFLLKPLLLLFAMIAGVGSVWGQDTETIASFSNSSHEGWTINNAEYATASGGYYKLTSSDASIVTPSINWSNYTDVTITISARKFGGPNADQGKITVSQGQTELTSYSPTGTSIVASSALSISPADGTITISCPGASSGKGCGVQTIVIQGKLSASGPINPIITISSENIAVGATATISAPKDLFVSYESNKTDVATVSAEGVVTGVAAGEATITASWGATDTYNAGSKQFTVTVVDATTYEKVTSTDQLVAGNEYILVATDYDKAMGAQGNNIRGYVDVTISDGDKVSITVEPVAVMTLGGTPDAWTFQTSDNDLYLAYSGSSNQVYTSDDATDAASKWKVTENFELESANVAGRVLKYNSGSPRFACYASGQQMAVLFVKSGSAVDTKADAELAFSETEIEVNVGKGDEFTAPTLSTAEGFDGTVTYSYVSSNQENSVILDEATGEILIEANAEGTITVTATSAATNNFKAGTASYTITIVDNRVEAGLAYSVEEFEARLGEDNTFPTLTNPNELAVSYKSSNEDVATVDAEGNVTLVGKGTTTITATSEATDTYKAGVASYVLTVVVPSTPVNGYYQKVTSTEDITDGQYLIVYEGDDTHESVAFDGGLETLDATNNTIEVTINDNTIAATSETQAAEFTINVTAGTVKSASGYYIGVSSNSNGLKTADDATTYTNAFRIDDFENAEIAAVFEGSTMTLGYNKASNQARFRYYKNAGQEAIQLYKYVTSVTVTAKKEYTTFCSTYDLDFSQVEGLEAYVVPSVSNTAAVINKVNKVPAGTGLILKKTGSETEFTVPVATETDNIGTNLMVGVTEATDMTGVANAYILSDGLFYACNGGTLAAGKAYLVAEDWATSTAPSFSIVEGGEATGIKSLTPALSQGEEVYYDLSGRRVAQPTNGVYIVNGKKVLVP